VWDYAQKRLVWVREFDPTKLLPQCLGFVPDGRFLVMGCTNGVVKFLRSDDLEDAHTFRPSHKAVTDIRCLTLNPYTLTPLTLILNLKPLTLNP
jgi:hypothetical protein